MHRYRKWLSSIEARQDIKLSDFYDICHSQVLIAGPGSGKTRILVMKAAYLLSEVIKPPQGLACLTYSRKLAREIQNRLWKIGIRKHSNIFIGTLHGFCLNAIARPFSDMFGISLPKPLRIASELRCAKAFRDAKKLTQTYCYRKSDFDIYRRTTYLDFRLGFSVEKELRNPSLEELISHYEKFLYIDTDERAIDFDMLIRISLKLILEEKFIRDILTARFPWILVDEYQDLGVALHRLVTSWANKSEVKVFTIGDPLQCIYQFQGACPQYLENLENDLPDSSMFTLQENYRSSKIISRASSVLCRAPNQRLMSLSMGYFLIWQCTNYSLQCQSAARVINEWICHGIEPEQITILTRNKKGIGEIIQSLGSIPYRTFRHPLYNDYTQLVSWLELVATWCSVGYNDGSVEFEDVLSEWFDIIQCDGILLSQDELFEERIRVYSILRDLCNPQMLLRNWLSQLDSSLGLQNLLDTKLYLFRPDDFEHYHQIKQLVQLGEELEALTVDSFGISIPRKGEVRINTIHGSKGSENDVVVVIGGEQLQKDKNLLYVAMTRARLALVILYSYKAKYVEDMIKRLRGSQNFSFLTHVSPSSLPKMSNEFYAIVQENS